MADTSFRIAFFSDPHIGPVPKVAWRLLAGKRVTGLINWRLTRKSNYDMPGLDAVVADILAQKPDHVICGGDISNLGLPEEFLVGRVLLEKLGATKDVSLVPGNHSAYVKSSVVPLLEILGPWMTGDGEDGPGFPYLRRRGEVGIVGLNSAVPRPPFDASGRLGEAQIEAARQHLSSLKRGGAARVVVVHHPPYLGGAPRDRSLRDAAAFEAMLKQTGADLVLHGHNHRTSLALRDGAGKMVPIVGVGSASERHASRGRKPVWLQVDLARDKNGAWTVAIEERAIESSGEISPREVSMTFVR